MNLIRMVFTQSTCASMTIRFRDGHSKSPHCNIAVFSHKIRLVGV